VLYVVAWGLASSILFGNLIQGRQEAFGGNYLYQILKLELLALAKIIDKKPAYLLVDLKKVAQFENSATVFSMR
jgi:hypothetical protein